ncbi:hypothetical protein D3C76_1726430 [compost metagenome]
MCATAQKVCRILHRVARVLAQFADPVAQIMGLAAHVVVGIVQGLACVSKGTFYTVDRLAELFTQSRSVLRRAGVERAILIEA